jgi:hypothetical protein
MKMRYVKRDDDRKMASRGILSDENERRNGSEE